MKKLSLLLVCLLFLGGCKFSPLSPEMQQKIDNQNGKIDEIKSNQNGIMLDLMKIRTDNQIHAHDIDNLQQGIYNRVDKNEGIQIFKGDGPIIGIFSFGVIAMLLVFYYRTLLIKSQKSCQIIADQVALRNDIDLENRIFLAAMNTEVEGEVYRLMVQSQTRTGFRGR